MCTVPKDPLVAVSSPSPQISPATNASHPIHPPLTRRKRHREVEGHLAGESSSSAGAPVTFNSSPPPPPPPPPAGVSAMRDTSENTTSNSPPEASTTATSPIPGGPDNTLLRKILIGDDIDSVRNSSRLADANFSLRRTSSMYSRFKTSSNPDPNSSDDKRRRSSTMFSQLSLPRRGGMVGAPTAAVDEHGDYVDHHRPCKRLKESSNSEAKGIPIKVESRDSEDGVSVSPSTSRFAQPDGKVMPVANGPAVDIADKLASKYPWKASKRLRPTSPARQSPSHSLSPPAGPSSSGADLTEAFTMRPRARTASELDVIRMIAEGKWAMEQRMRLEAPFDPRKIRKLTSATGIAAKGNRDLLRRVGEDPGDKNSNITSPLSELLESTPPYGPSTIHPRSNTTNSVFPWSAEKTTNALISRLNLSFPGPNGGSKRAVQQPPTQSQTQPPPPPSQQQQQPQQASSSSSSASHRQQTHQQVLDMLNLTKNPESMASLLAAASPRFFQGIREEQVLNFSQQEVVVSRHLPPPPPPPPAPLPLHLTSDDTLQWTPHQLAALQQLFRLSNTSAAAAAVAQSIASVSTRSEVSDRQEAMLPIRLTGANRVLQCRRVAEWMLVANTWTMHMCPAPIMPENSLLATAATYRYCRCSEAEFCMTPHPQIDLPLEMPRVGRGLRAVLHRIWPQLLLASMIRENFAFDAAPIPAAELGTLISGGAGGGAGGGGGGAAVDGELNIAKAGTATALQNLIRTGNQLFLNTQVFESVRKCIFAQHAYPEYYSVSYASAMEELRNSCGNDANLVNSVVMLMNEMQSINPEGLHCLFSIDRLAGLFMRSPETCTAASS